MATLSLAGAGLALVADAWGPDDGPPVLLLHGAGQTRHAWRSTGELLGGHGWRAVAVDLRGHGDSDRAADGRYVLRAFADDVLGLARAMPGPPVLIGASLGGLASLVAIAEGGPGTASGLVLVDIATHVERSGSARVQDFMRRHPDGFDSLEEVAAAVSAFRPERPPTNDVSRLRRNVRRRPDGRWEWHWDPRLMDGGVDSLTHEVRNVHTGEVELAHRAVVRAAARAVTLPTLLVRGQRSELISDESVRQLQADMPHADYVNVRDAGHMVVGDDNAAFNDAVLAFLRSLRPASRR
ncbi:MAG: putative non-hem bromoperoxidase (Bromide peroxidase) [Actinomycetia bacterium]|nr:putative non-hem bromoperoxidase (Bromide peroxidase) [Actinomycetes bacterium]